MDDLFSHLYLKRKGLGSLCYTTFHLADNLLTFPVLLTGLLSFPERSWTQIIVIVFPPATLLDNHCLLAIKMLCYFAGWLQECKSCIIAHELAGDVEAVLAILGKDVIYPMDETSCSANYCKCGNLSADTIFNNSSYICFAHFVESILAKPAHTLIGRNRGDQYVPRVYFSHPGGVKCHTARGPEKDQSL